MTLKNKITEEIKTAMKSGDKIRLNLFRVLKGELARVEDSKNELTDDQVIKMFQKFIKNLEMVNDERSKQEIEILNEYMPKQLAENEIEDIIQSLIVTNNYSSMKDMGKIMSDFTADYSGQADMKLVSTIVRKNLS
tara:strand:+ start:453 stop:860 length:408 start_codon:yes stop_codon:yes gene_type:complete